MLFGAVAQVRVRMYGEVRRMATFWISIVDSAYRTLGDAQVRAPRRAAFAIDLNRAEGRHIGHAPDGAGIVVRAHADGYEPEEHTVALDEGVTQIVIGLRSPRQSSYTRGACRLAFTPVHGAVLARVRAAAASRLLADAAAPDGIRYRIHGESAAADDDLLVRIEASGDARMITRIHCATWARMWISCC
jgi:hypothetical protein